jgi:uncharacterized membrane protein YebE (DUF533 family)
MIDTDKILLALQTDPAEALRALRERAAQVADHFTANPDARAMAMAGAGGAAAGLVAGVGAPRLAGAIIKLGGLAALGGLAYQAWRRYEANASGAAPPAAADFALAPPGFLPDPRGPDGERLARLTLKAMINAAKADGQIDAEEKARLFDRLGQVSLSDDERDFLFAELARPMDTEGLVAEASAPALAAHVYAASLLAIDPERPAEKAYLKDLAQLLGLDGGLVAEIRAAA